LDLHEDSNAQALQLLQDRVSLAMNMASITIDCEGNLVTKGSGYTKFCPGFTPSEISTNLKAHAEGRPDAPKYPGLMPISYVADQVAYLMEHPRRIYVIPKTWKLLVLTAYLLPGLADALVPLFRASKD
jgi:hypothetical protein